MYDPIRKPQTQLVLKLLVRRPKMGVTVAEAKRMGINKLSARISEIRDSFYMTDSVITKQTKKHGARYILNV